MFHSQARRLQLALAQKGRGGLLFGPSYPLRLSSRDDLALVPVHSAVKILSVILDSNPHLTYGDLWLLLGGIGGMSRSRDVCKADTSEPFPSPAAQGSVLGPHLRASQALGAAWGPRITWTHPLLFCNMSDEQLCRPPQCIEDSPFSPLGNTLDAQ